MFDRFDRLLTIIIKLFIIVIIAVGGLWFCVSVYANFAMKHQQAVTAIPEFPAADRARYIFIIKSTGETILTNAEDTLGTGKYILHGYYELKERKWVFHKIDLPLDVKTFGPITMIER
jgi:hypothetical protein